MRKLTSRLFLAALGCLAFSGACGGDDAAPVTPVNYVPLLKQLDGSDVGDSLDLLCNGTLGLSVQLWRKPFADEGDGLKPVEAENDFVLRPANACGSASRCGYIRFEALDADDNVVASTDSATTSGVLTFSGDIDPNETSKLRVTLIHGYDQTRFVNPDETEASSDASVTLVPAAEPCTDDGTGGAGGAGGAPNEPVGGAATGGAGGEPGTGGFGGATGGAGGESLGGAPSLPLGGAGAGGA